MEYTSNNQHHLTQNKLPELSSHLEQLASALVLRTLDMEVHSRKWNLIIQGVKGPANENESATRKTTIDLAKSHLRVVNAADSQIAACHRLNNKENAPIIVKFCDLSERNRWLDGAKNLKNQIDRIRSSTHDPKPQDGTSENEKGATGRAESQIISSLHPTVALRRIEGGRPPNTETADLTQNNRPESTRP